MMYETGEIVKSLAGHDKDDLYMILRCEGDMLWLVDGRLKKLDAPKKKKTKHVQLIHRSVPQQDRDKNEMIQHFLKSYGGNECQNPM